MRHGSISLVGLALAFACAPIVRSAESTSAPATPIQRRPVLSVELATARTVSRVEATEITLAEGTTAPRHRHPCPVIGQVLDGTIRFQVEGSPEQLLHAGDAFLEPANAAVVHFDNAGSREARFVAFYLVDGADESALIEIFR